MWLNWFNRKSARNTPWKITSLPKTLKHGTTRSPPDKAALFDVLNQWSTWNQLNLISMCKSHTLSMFIGAERSLFLILDGKTDTLRNRSPEGNFEQNRAGFVRKWFRFFYMYILDQQCLIWFKHLAYPGEGASRSCYVAKVLLRGRLPERRHLLLNQLIGTAKRRVWIPAFISAVNRKFPTKPMFATKVHLFPIRKPTYQAFWAIIGDNDGG